MISPHVVDPSASAALGELAAAGPGAAADPAAYALVIESIREGYLLHYGEPRVVRSDDPDLRLLAGDYLYAVGLERLAGLGDLDAIRELSDLIALGAQLADESEADGPPRAAEALWLASALGVGLADGAFLDAARRAIMSGQMETVIAPNGTAFALAERAGIGDALIEAAHAIDFRRSQGT